MMTEISQDTLIPNNGIKNAAYSDEHQSIPSTPLQSSALTPCHLNLINTFPWIAEFMKLCHEDMTYENIRSLEMLMNFYHKNVCESVKECYSEPIRATKLKTSISEVMIFFHMSFSELKLRLDSSSFLAKMSDLMALYLDMEIKTSRSGTESLQNIASKITSSLFIYFGSSHVHILDTILKAKMINKDSWELSDLIFRRVLRDSPGSPLHVITYIRYLLAFKLWKGIISSAEERKTIQLMAESQLIPPPDFREKISLSSMLIDIFPNIPECETNITQFLLETKYDVNDKIEIFLKAVSGTKLKSDLDSHRFVSTNYSFISDEKVDDWSLINLRSDVEDCLLLNIMNNDLDNKTFSELKHIVRSDSKNELELENEMSLEDTDGDENDFQTIDSEEMIKKDQNYHVDSFWEGGAMGVDAEIELPSTHVDVTDIPAIKLEPQPSQSKDNVVYSWDIPNTQPYQNYRNTSEQVAIFDLQNKSQVCIGKEPVYGTCSNIEDNSSAQRFTLVHTEQVLTDAKTIDVPRTQRILNNKYFPFTPMNIPYKKHNYGILHQDKNEEISSEEHNGELSLEEFNENIHLRELNGAFTNQRYPAELNDKKCLGECFNTKTMEFSNMEKPSEYNEETPPEKRGLVHDFTLKNDNEIYKFHLKLSSFWEKLNRHTWISLLFPLFSEQDVKTTRCTCFRCTQNYNTIMKNWKSAVTNLSRLPRDPPDLEIFSGHLDNNILREMKELLETDGLKLLVWEPEVDELHTKIEELIKEENKHSHLPLKKRKALSLKTYLKDEKQEISYPSTPMMSIAEVELAKEQYRFNAMKMSLPPTSSAHPPPLNYIPDYLSQPGYPNPSDIKCDDIIEQANFTNISSDQYPVPEAFTNTFSPEVQNQNRPKFKTPAQLKEFQNLSAAEDLISFSQTSRAYCNENREPGRENEKEERTNSQKTRISRKRKQTT